MVTGLSIAKKVLIVINVVLIIFGLGHAMFIIYPLHHSYIKYGSNIRHYLDLILALVHFCAIIINSLWGIYGVVKEKKGIVTACAIIMLPLAAVNVYLLWLTFEFIVFADKLLAPLAIVLQLTGTVCGLYCRKFVEQDKYV